MSPIVCRDHNKDTGEDIYYTGENNEFIEIIKRNLYSELREEYIKWLKNEQIDIDSKKTAYVDYMKNTNTKDMAQKLAFFVDGFPKELSKNYQKYI